MQWVEGKTKVEAREWETKIFSVWSDTLYEYASVRTAVYFYIYVPFYEWRDSQYGQVFPQWRSSAHVYNGAAGPSSSSLCCTYLNIHHLHRQVAAVDWPASDPQNMHHSSWENLQIKWTPMLQCSNKLMDTAEVRTELLLIHGLPGILILRVSKWWALGSFQDSKFQEAT